MTNNTNMFKAILDKDMAALAAADAVREAIVAVIISNTAANRRVDEKDYQNMLDEAKRFIFTSNIQFYFDAKLKKDFCFIGSPQQQLEKLQSLFTTITTYNAWYEDKDAKNVEDNRYEGFCWKTDSGHCALYCPVVSSDQSAED